MFNKKSLTASDSGISGLNRSFEYFSSDVVTAKSYFPKLEDLKAGDKVTKVVITKVSGLVTNRVETPYFLVDDANGELTATVFA